MRADTTSNKMFTLRAIRPLVRLEVRCGFGDAIGISRGADSAGHIQLPNRISAALRA